MKLYYPITVDLYNIYPLPIMPAQQANIGRGAQVTLTANSAAVVPEDELVNIYVKKPDGTKVYADCTVSGNQIQVDFTQQMLLVPGMLEVELQMIDAEGNNITTPIFLIQNQRSNIDYAGITSSDEFTALVTALAEVEDLKKNGLKGDAATVTVGTTTTGEPGTEAAVNNSGTTGDAVLNFTIPRGADGSMWYYGDDITGTNTSGTVFAGSGITAANAGDKYLNISTGDDKGNVYNCTVAGDASKAQWTYIGNIEGPQGPEGPAGTQEIIFAARSAFPETGQENMLYIDNTVNPALAYVWNGSNYIPAGGGGAIAAADVTYDNTSSSLEADTVQEAIDANAAAISSLNSRIGGLDFIGSIYVASDAETPYQFANPGAYLLGMEDGYAVGQLWFASVGNSFNNRNVTVADIASGSGYYTITGTSPSNIKITAGGANGTLHIYRL